MNGREYKYIHYLIKMEMKHKFYTIKNNYEYKFFSKINIIKFTSTFLLKMKKVSRINMRKCNFYKIKKS